MSDWFADLMDLKFGIENFLFLVPKDSLHVADSNPENPTSIALLVTEIQPFKVWNVK